MKAEDKLKQIPISDVCALSQCPVGSECEICTLVGDPDERLRLLNLGFRNDCRVELVQVRNDHYIVCINGSRYALSKQLANSIEVRPKHA